MCLSTEGARSIRVFSRDLLAWRPILHRSHSRRFSRTKGHPVFYTPYGYLERNVHISCMDVQIDLNYVKYFCRISSLRRCRASLSLAFCSAFSSIACFLKEINNNSCECFNYFHLRSKSPRYLTEVTRHYFVSATQHHQKIICNNLQHNWSQEEVTPHYFVDVTQHHQKVICNITEAKGCFFFPITITVKVLLKVLIHFWAEWKWQLKIIIMFIYYYAHKGIMFHH